MAAGALRCFFFENSPREGRASAEKVQLVEDKGTGWFSMVGCGKTMRQCMGLYLRMKEQCFVGSRPYPSQLLESILKENLGELTVMSDIKHPKIMVTAVMADRKPVDLHLFRNYTSVSDILGLVTSTNKFRLFHFFCLL